MDAMVSLFSLLDWALLFLAPQEISNVINPIISTFRILSICYIEKGYLLKAKIQKMPEKTFRHYFKIGKTLIE